MPPPFAVPLALVVEVVSSAGVVASPAPSPGAPIRLLGALAGGLPGLALLVRGHDALLSLVRLVLEVAEVDRLEGDDGDAAGQIEPLPVGDDRPVLAVVVAEDAPAGAEIEPDRRIAREGRDVDDVADDGRGTADLPARTLGPLDLAGLGIDGIDVAVVRAEVDGRPGPLRVGGCDPE